MEMLSLENLAHRTDIPLATLNNCLAAGLVPQQTWLRMERRSDGFVVNTLLGVFLVCAIRMQQAGFTDRAIFALLSQIFRYPSEVEPDAQLPAAMRSVSDGDYVVVYIADGGYVRWKVDGEDNGWMYVCGHAVLPATGYAPYVVTAIDLGLIREKIAQQFPCTS